MTRRDGNGLTEAEFLAAYRAEDYPRPSVACDMAVFAVAREEADSYRQLPEPELRVLLIQRGGHPCLGDWALPGGFVRPGETVGRAAERELREETGLSRVYLRQLGVFSQPGRDPRTWVMSCAHLALIRGDRAPVQGGDDARQAAWFRVRCPAAEGGRLLRLELTRGDTRLTAAVEYRGGAGGFGGPEEFRLAESRGLAFDHGLILGCALWRLRREAERGGLPFHLMPERFTLTELQQVYEVVLGRPLAKAAFRKRVAPLVEETEEYGERGGHRPARLYQRRQKGADNEQL